MRTVNYGPWLKISFASIEIKPIEQYFYAVLFIMLYKVLQTLNFVDETLVCDYFK